MFVALYVCDIEFLKMIKKLLFLILPVLLAGILSGCYYATAPLSSQSFKDAKLLGQWQNINNDFDKIISLEISLDASSQYQLKKVYAAHPNLKREQLNTVNMIGKDYRAIATQSKPYNVLSVEVEEGRYNFFPYIVEGNQLTLYDIKSVSWKKYIESGQLKGRIETKDGGSTYYLEDTGPNMLKVINQFNLFSDFSVYAVLKK